MSRDNAAADAGAPARASTARRVAALVVLAACVGVAGFVYTREGFSLDPLVLRDRIAELGWLAPAAFVAFAVLRIFFGLPSFVVMSVGGLLFGTLGGMLWGSLGFSLGALLSFAIARGLGRDAVARRLGARTKRFDEMIAQRGAPWIAAYTAVPVTPLTAVHASAGLTAISPPSFALAVVAGVVPRAALLSYFGDAIAAGDGGRIVVASLVIALVAITGSAWVRRASNAGALPRDDS